MPNQVSFMPPGRTAAAAARGPVRRRHVLYVPGYDPEAKSRSRSLFVRELVRYGRRFGLRERAVTAVEELPEVPGLRWRVRTARDDWATETVYDVLRWDDIVERDFRRSMVACLAWLVVSTLDALASGLTVRLFRMNWLFACVTIFPATMIAMLAFAASGLGIASALLLSGTLGAPWWAALGGGIAAGAGLVALARPFYAEWYVWHLLDDWLFNWEHGNGWRRDYEARVERFAAHLRDVVASSGADEILVVGHSSGAGMAAETVARALDGQPDLGRRGPEIAVLTIGTSLPVAAMNPRARVIRRNLVRLMREPDVLWVEYQAPQDWLNSAGFNPLRMLKLDLAEAACTNPVIRSARFAEITSEKTYRMMLKSPFRMHFQFMMANDRPGEYDFIMMMLGPMRLSERIRDPEAASRLVGEPPAAPVEEPLPA